MRNWTAEERQRQRELIQSWKPWTKSTGAKTHEGKKRSSQNAFKTGKSIEIRKLTKILNSLFREQKKLLR
jgi:hypothetical protein